MILYHGGPITPMNVAVEVWSNRHALVSFANQEQMELAAEISQSFVLDNGAFTIWTQGGTLDRNGYYRWVEQWYRHPGFDWALIPDVIDGTVAENDEAIYEWPFEHSIGVPVWHLNEPLDRLERLVLSFPRVAMGSSGQWAKPNTPSWWERMTEALSVCCDSSGRPIAKLHGLRMMNPAIFSRIPFASVDSSSIARNVGLDTRWNGPYCPRTKKGRAVVMLDRLEAVRGATTWKQDEESKPKRKVKTNKKTIVDDRQMVFSLSDGLVGTETVLDTSGIHSEADRRSENKTV